MNAFSRSTSHFSGMVLIGFRGVTRRENVRRFLLFWCLDMLEGARLKVPSVSIGSMWPVGETRQSSHIMRRSSVGMESKAGCVIVMMLK